MAKKTKRRKIEKLWLARDKGGCRHDYWVYPGRPTFESDGTELRCGMWDTPESDGISMCPEQFEACTPKSMHLKPGGGPVQVKLVRV